MYQDQLQQLNNSLRGEMKYGDYIRQGMDAEAGAPAPPPPPTADANLAFDPAMDRQVDMRMANVQAEKERLLAMSKNKR